MFNAAEGIPNIYRGSARAEIIWTDEDILAFEQEALRQGSTHIADGLRLAALTGLRREDLVTLTWEEVGEIAIEKLAAKVSRGRRRRVIIPRLPALDELLNELRARSRVDGVNTVLVNSYGRAWSVSGFGGSFNRIRDGAGIVHIDRDSKKEVKKHLHDVRGTFCTNLITAGKLADREVAEIMGWSPDKVAGIRRTYVDQGAVNMAIAGRLREGL
ncbi:MAG: tyrosine-type recombinase/integrase [Novosphingobium sp.]